MRTVIKSLSTSTGYLENSPLQFSEGLNCIIGTRGTCKSTIIETIRFVFDSDPERVRYLLQESESSPSLGGSPSSKGLVRASLRDGTAKCVVVSDKGGDGEEELLIERSMDSNPRVYREGVQEIVGNSSARDRVEIYSQGQLERIAEDSSLRLQLIDRPHQDRVSHLKKQRKDFAVRLRDLGPQIRRLRNEADARRPEIRNLETYRRELDILKQSRPQLSPELSAEQEAFRRRKEILDKLHTFGKERVQVLSSIIMASRDYAKFRDGVGLLDGVQYPEADVLRERLRALTDFLERTRVEAESLASDSMGPSIEALQGYFDQENEAYFSLRRQQQEVSENLRKEDTLRQQIEKMVEIENQVLALEKEFDALKRERQALRAEMENINDQLYHLRLEEVRAINSEFGNDILLNLRQGTESGEYKNLVNTLLQGSRIRNQEDVASDIASKVLPSDLVDIVECGDATRLSEALGRDLGQMTRLVSHLLDNPRLYDLEALVFEDWLDITMYISGEPKPISQLSKGQMATALLPLILREAPYPLIFDQPEDDLDNAFIYNLIARVRELKRQRQLIFVTHNANIPVLGEAERVIVMSMRNPQRASQPFVGSVDESREHILKLLEGGAEAFRRRQEKYGELLG